MPQSALAEISKQVCIVCYARYSGERAAGMLPCQHHFCAECIERALAILKAEAAERASSNPVAAATLAKPA